ncbi:hypothetical protein GCM10009647_084850 [Streptomyces sanglieri]
MYADALLLVNALKRHDVAMLENRENTQVNLHTMLSDVQRNANGL